MKHLTKTLFSILLVASFGTIKAQSDLLADNTAYAPSNIVALYHNDEKITFSELMPKQENTSLVTVKCANSTKVQVKYFNMDGNMAKQELRTLDKGVNELDINTADLAAGMYMVQFYSSEGSAVRRLVKAN